MTMKETKLFNRINIRRGAVILLIILIILALILGQRVFASNDGSPLRSAHKVKAGEKSFCFFVANNVVLTQSELAAMDDETLVNEIFRRTGIFIKEASCNDPGHPLISVDEWIAAGNTLSISEEDIASIRQAAPAAGTSAKFHMDIQFTLKPEEKEEPEEEPADDPSEEPGEEPSGDPGDVPEEPGEEPSDEPSDDPSGDPVEDPSGEITETPSEGTGGDQGSDPAEDPSQDPTDDPSEDPAGDPSDEPGDDPSDDPSTDPSDDPGDDPSDDPSEEPSDEPEIREIYTTYKLTSPELLFIVVVCDEDAGVTDDECETIEPALPDEPEMPEIPEIDIDIPDVPEDMLPEYRKIDMVDKTGPPLTPVLEDGEPVELTWIEPKNTIDPETARNWVESFPGGEIGFGGMIAGLAAIITGITIAVKKKQRDDY